MPASVVGAPASSADSCTCASCTSSNGEKSSRTTAALFHSLRHGKRTFVTSSPDYLTICSDACPARALPLSTACGRECQVGPIHFTGSNKPIPMEVDTNAMSIQFTPGHPHEQQCSATCQLAAAAGANLALLCHARHATHLASRDGGSCCATVRPHSVPAMAFALSWPTRASAVRARAASSVRHASLCTLSR